MFNPRLAIWPWLNKMERVALLKWAAHPQRSAFDLRVQLPTAQSLFDRGLLNGSPLGGRIMRKTRCYLSDDGRKVAEWLNVLG